MKKLFTSLRAIDQNLLKWLLVGFIFIIPLYPKLPLLNVNYTYIHIRLEDVYMAIISVVFFIQFLRRKISVNKRFAIIIGLFWVAVITSFVIANFVLKSLPEQHLKVSLLHALRRIEYMIVFFIAASQVKTKKDFYFYLNCVLAALGLVALYGVGQKVFGWCAYQTMNPEFSKGYCLRLASESRISSTFAGHYDLAAYLTLIIPVVLGIYAYLKKPRYMVVFVLALICMVFTASRASYGSYLLSVVPFLLFRKQWKLLVVVLVLTAVFTPLSGELTSRIKRSFQSTQLYVNRNDGTVVIPQDIEKLPAGRNTGKIDVKNLPVAPVGTGAASIAAQVDPKAQAIIEKDIEKNLRADLKKRGIIATEEDIDKQVDQLMQNYIPIKQVLPDISQSVRYYVSWPRAIKAFYFNPITGKGPFSLGEATDGDYFRWLGEFGLFGTLTFLYIFIAITQHIVKNLHKFVREEKHVFYGFLFGMLGLLINATYIDVFEASKVAYHVWLLAGLFVAAASLSKEEAKKEMVESSKATS